MNTLSRILKLVSPSRRGRSASLIRSIAGMPAGVQQDRRGSVLVLVIGALALISVITLVYATIGQGDRRSGASSVRKANTVNTVEAVADYIKRVIADGTISTTVQSGPGVTPPILVRAAADYPYTDPYRRSTIQGGSTSANYMRRFNATGSYSEALTTTLDPRVQSTPFLASSVPTSMVPPTSSSTTFDNFNRFHDWLHITNISPDGRFVNLWNLAPVVGGQRVSGFEAESAMTLNGLVGNPAAPFLNGNNQVVCELSYDLSLYNAAGVPTDTLVTGTLADPNIPAHWSSQQQWMFRPSTGPMFSPTNAAGSHQPNSPGDSWYAPYQYCDTDGDGMFDARWFELVDASDPNNPISLLPRDDRFRWFAAVRVVDLSGMVNVNTATDFKRPAQLSSSEVTKFGATPADVDLRRLFLMDDFFHQFGAGYGALQVPAYPGLEDDYSAYIAGPVGRNVGDRAYAALRLALRQNGQDVVAPGTDLANPPGGPIPAFTGDDRFVYFDVLGAHPASGYMRLPPPSAAVGTFESSARFGSADLKELLTYWSVNNPGSLSRLEQTTVGRFDAANGGSAATDSFDPLRCIRDLQTERGGNDDAQNSGLGDGLGDTDALARSMFDVRHYITPLNGARPLRAGIVPVGAKFELRASVDQRVDALAALRKATTATAASRDATQLFLGYLDALLPYSTRVGAYGGDPTLNTLAYGHSGEKALRTAAALTVNLIDSHDTDDIPSAYTLLIDEDQRTNVQSDMTSFPWWQAGTSGQLDAVTQATAGSPEVMRIARASDGDVVQASKGAINIYGIEAQPFITQVVSLCMYTDAMQADGGDADYDPVAIPPDPITISGGQVPADVLGQVIAFQLTNPFDVKIELTKATTAGGGDPVITDADFTDFYIGFGGDLYMLARASASSIEAVVLQPGETRVFYAMNKSEAEILADWQKVYPAATAATLNNYLAAQLGIEASPTSVPEAGELLPDGRLRPIPIKRKASVAQDPPDSDLLDGSTASKSHVLLWRTLRTAAEQTANTPGNDMLCDHLRDPGPSGAATDPPQATLDRRLPNASKPVINTLAGDETGGNPEDNTGFSIVTWGSIRRHDDSSAGTGTPPLGGIPAYCIEAKWGSTPLSNVSDNVSIDPANLSKGDFTGNVWSDTTILGLMTKLTGIGMTDPPTLTNVIIPEITKRPQDRTGQSMPANADMPSRTYDKLYPKIALNNKKFEAAVQNYRTVSTLRVADLLTPLGIGPMNDPGIPVDPDDPGAQYLALSEALGLALNYSSPTSSDTNWAPLYEKYGDWQTGTTDRGNLVLDRFAPFEDAGSNGVFNANADQPRAPGIPLGLNIMNVFSVTPQEMGNLTQATPGLININTAAPAVVQLLPLLSPTTEPGVWLTFKTDAGVAAGTTVPEPSSGPGAGDGTDIASTVIGHRDKLPTLDRDGQPITFADSSGVSPFGVPSTFDGRRLTTNIDGIRETPGWGSVAEMMTLIDRTGTGGAPGNTRIPTTDQVDYLGSDTFASGMKGTVATLVKDTSVTPSAGKLDEVKDDWDEKLQVASAAMGTATVRSDMFAVWFVVHGYQKSDTEGLKPEDVLTPSIAKRYLMVLDRSNVTRKGEKPRVVFITEVPL